MFCWIYYAGDEMTRIFWKSIKDKVIFTFLVQNKMMGWVICSLCFLIGLSDSNFVGYMFAAYFPFCGVGHQVL